MLLCIDIGNTNIVFAVYDGENQIEQARMETTGKIPESINEIAQKYPTIRDVIVSSVVPKANEAIEKSCTYFLKTEPVFINHHNAGIDINLDTPAEVGADRLVNAVAVQAHYQKPAVIVDFGTATTFDVIDGSGVYNGGVIAPGINLSMKALHMAAAQLPDIPVESTQNVIGKNTKDAMQSGLYWGYISMIEGVLKRISEEINETPFVIATGGLAPLFMSGTNSIEAIDQDLTMKGLVHIHAQLVSVEDGKSAACH
jgi:type III pantothenate kinase